MLVQINWALNKLNSSCNIEETYSMLIKIQVFWATSDHYT
jgi:hypothetical protein